jgi:hypothetical protein
MVQILVARYGNRGVETFGAWSHSPAVKGEICSMLEYLSDVIGQFSGLATCRI